MVACAETMTEGVTAHQVSGEIVASTKAMVIKQFQKRVFINLLNNLEMYKFGQCPTYDALGSAASDWPQLEPDGCRSDSDCPGLWKCCPSFVATGEADEHHVDVGTTSCTQPWLDNSMTAQLPLCLQHMWNVTESGRTFGGCDLLMCDDSSGGRAFDRWQCNYCDANSTTCYCFINFDNDGKYWGELPGSRQKLGPFADETTDRPGVIHRTPKHECSLQDRCPQMFPHTIYCSHGIQRDSSGCPTGECLPNPEEKCFAVSQFFLLTIKRKILKLAFF